METYNRVRLTVCIAVFNQSQILENTLRTILSYPKDDIRVVVSDDCSTEDIRGLVESFFDRRVIYCKTPRNLGHDKNILHALQHSQSRFSFLLRTKDCVYPQNIEKILSVIEAHKSAGYFGFSCVDQNEKIVLKYKNSSYALGKQALEIRNQILVHPSGHVYDTQRLDFSLLEKYVDDFPYKNLAFFVHILISIQLAEKCDFVLSDVVGWIYPQKTSDIAVNRAPNQKSVYHPDYEIERYKSVINYLIHECGAQALAETYRPILVRYFRSICFEFGHTNNDTWMQKHYSYVSVKYSRFKEISRFVRTTKQLFKFSSFGERMRVNFFLFLEIVKLFSGFYLLRYITMKWLRKVNLYASARSLYVSWRGK